MSREQRSIDLDGVSEDAGATYCVAAVCGNCDETCQAAIPKGTPAPYKIVLTGVICPNCGCESLIRIGKPEKRVPSVTVAPNLPAAPGVGQPSAWFRGIMAGLERRDPTAGRIAESERQLDEAVAAQREHLRRQLESDQTVAGGLPGTNSRPRPFAGFNQWGHGNAVPIPAPSTTNSPHANAVEPSSTVGPSPAVSVASREPANLVLAQLRDHREMWEVRAELPGNALLDHSNREQANISAAAAYQAGLISAGGLAATIGYDLPTLRKALSDGQ